MEGDSCIQVRELSVTYRKNRKKAVDRVSLDLPPGYVHGLLGANGAGKTTLLSVLCGVMRPGSGSAHVLGHELPREKEEVKEKIGVVPQEIALYPALTVRENLFYIGKMQRIPKASLRERVEDAIAAFQLEEKAGERVDRLSGGMKRRVNLMAGTLHRPELLFLDEPTTGIDVHSRGMILDHLKSLREQGVTLLYTSHDLEEAQELCDRIAVMDEGRIVKDDLTDELLEGGPASGKKLRDLLLRITASEEEPERS